MLDEELMINYVCQTLKDNKKPSFLSTNRKELTVRCPDCGDSKNPNHAHLYIEMKAPFLFHCKKCGFSGYLTSEVLRYLDIFDIELEKTLKILNKNSKKTIKYNIRKNFDTKYDLEKRDFDSFKFDYLNKRFDLKYDDQYWLDNYKVITNVEDFIRKNNIYDNPKIMKSLTTFDKDYVGFLSSDKTHCIFRDVTNKHTNRRYWNWNIYNAIEGVSKFYTISRNIDLMSDNITLVITEGIFDIIGVYEHFYKDKIKDSSNYIFAAAAGRSFETVINYFIKLGFLNLKIIIYSDADVDLYSYKKMKRKSDYIFNNNITIYYNDFENEKDFGVPKDRVTLKKAKI